MAVRPAGVRVQIRSDKNVTSLFDSQGHKLFKLKSFLPGGGLSEQVKNEGGTSIFSSKSKQFDSSCTLDCILIKDRKIAVVVDLLEWGGQSYC